MGYCQQNGQTHRAARGKKENNKALRSPGTGGGVGMSHPIRKKERETLFKASAIC